MPKSLLKPSLLLILLLLLISVLYGYHKILPHGPYSFHEWRQSDCLAITLNYYKDNLGFLTPAFQWVSNDGNSKTISEFPIIYYTVGQLWKVFGQHAYIFRLLNLLIVFSGLFFMFRLIRQQIGDNFWAIMSVLFVFTSPLLVFYANNFMPDAPALSFGVIGCYFLMRYYNARLIRWLYIACFFFLLGGLIKISSLLLFVGVLPIHLYNVFLKKDQKFSKASLIPFALVLLTIASWYAYVNYYNSHNVRYFLGGILPIWELSFSQRRDISIDLFNFIMPSYFSQAGLFMLFFMFLYSVFNWRRANPFLITLNVICFLGSVLFVILFYGAFNLHDYHLVNMLIMIPLTVLTFLDLLKRINPGILDNRQIKILAMMGLAMLVYNTMVKTRLKYDYNDYFVGRSFAIDKPMKEYYGWYHWNYSNTFEALETIQPYLRQLGIQRTDLVVSLPDQSPNMTLYLMDQKGFSDFGGIEPKSEATINRYIELGAKYLIINDKRLYEQAYFKRFIQHKIGAYKNVDIYSLENLPLLPPTDSITSVPQQAATMP